ncbi:PaeR7I family type II restriction endonuclease [Actinoplanes sp. NBRC 103695]|uniref:PaeR7I family type II restriction endonuclease n=1 Tax=Actinoplanes sp. NBRC 103695 TaxID=3032202 RepID=UPI002552F61D|nr:PaeR7I family type II restriction endonuclease [Actinoplanes sp. NBRC 103695]
MTPEQSRDLDNALLAYWTSRDEAAVKQQASNAPDVGGRAGVTSGGHLDRVAQLLGKVCIAAGAPAEQVYYKAPKGDPYRRPKVKKGYTLPGYFRPTKEWDVVVYHEGVPIAVIELKSQNGPSYGNNANNRAEEAIGNAVDLARAAEAGLVQGRPWIGYAFVIEDDERSRAMDGRKTGSLLHQDRYFDDWSYVGRICLLCSRLTEERFYDSAWVVATSRPTCPAPVGKLHKCPQIAKGISPHLHKFGRREPDVNLGYVSFITGLSKQIEKYYSSGPATGDPKLSLAG